MRKAVLLINPGHEREGGAKHSSPHRIHRDIPPMPILTLGSYLRQKGTEVVIFDSHVESDYRERLVELIKTHDFTLVGMTVFVGRFISNAIELGKLIKRLNPELPIVWGGPLVSVLPEKSLQEGGADFVIAFEGEIPLFLLADSLNERGKIDHIPNLGYFQNGRCFFTRVDYGLDTYQEVLQWELLGEKINRKQIPYIAYLLSSRGCPYHCAYCYHMVDSSNRIVRKYQCKSAERVLEEIDLLRSCYGIKVVTFGDDNFLAKRDRALTILQGIRERGMYIEQCVGTFANLNEEIIKALSGICQTVICSIESASERLLKETRRPGSLAAVEPTVRKLCDNGMNSYHNFMFGLPTETDEDRKSAVDLAVRLKRINPYVRLVPYLFTPLPGTPLYKQMNEKLGQALDKPLEEWSDCEFAGGRRTYKYRPWISEKEQDFLSTMVNLFREFFVSLNSRMTREQQSLIESSGRLRYIFQAMDQITFPSELRPKYLLDEMLGVESLFS